MTVTQTWMGTSLADSDAEKVSALSKRVDLFRRNWGVQGALEPWRTIFVLIHEAKTVCFLLCLSAAGSKISISTCMASDQQQDHPCEAAFDGKSTSAWATNDATQASLRVSSPTYAIVHTHTGDSHRVIMRTRR